MKKKIKGKKSYLPESLLTIAAIKSLIVTKSKLKREEIAARL